VLKVNPPPSSNVYLARLAHGSCFCSDRHNYCSCYNSDFFDVYHHYDQGFLLLLLRVAWAEFESEKKGI
jgi:hypothetical protein